jgi:hypothetical protein
MVSRKIATTALSLARPLVYVRIPHLPRLLAVQVVLHHCSFERLNATNRLCRHVSSTAIGL